PTISRRTFMAEIGLVGLGRMGGNMTTRLRVRGHRVVVFDQSLERARQVATETGAVAAASLGELCGALAAPRAVWVMVPAGAPTSAVISELAGQLAGGDTIIDGGNSNYKESMQRARELLPRNLFFVDAGTSGGIWGLKNGYCLMVGGDAA